MMDWEDTPVLVTGGDGFIGSRLVTRLEKLSADVTVASKSESGRGKFVRIDVTKQDSLDFEGQEVVFHLAGIADPKICEENPEQAFLINSYGTLNVMEECRRSNIERMVLSSSAHVYGAPEGVPVAEDHPLRPTSTYGRSKVAAESICLSYGATVLRFFNVYGPGQRGDYLIPTILSKLEGGSITLRNLDSKRDFIYVNDVVDAMLLAVDSPRECFNIGSGRGSTPKEIAELLSNASGKRPKLVSMNKPDRIKELVADIGKAKRLLGWEPKVNLEDGLRITYEEFE